MFVRHAAAAAPSTLTKERSRARRGEGSLKTPPFLPQTALFHLLRCLSGNATLGKAAFPPPGGGWVGDPRKRNIRRDGELAGGAARTGDVGSGTEGSTVKKDNGDGWSPSLLHSSRSPSARSLQ